MGNIFSVPQKKRMFLSILDQRRIYCSIQIVVLTWLIGLMCFSPQANASIHHVGVQGTDAPGAGTEQLPFQTIQFAYNQANPTDTIILLPGVYHQQFTFALIKDVVLGSKYLLTQDTSFISTTIIDGSQYFGASALIEIYGGESNIEIIGLTIRNSTAKAVVVQNSGVSYLSNCYLINNGNISLWGTFSATFPFNSLPASFRAFEIRNSRFIGNRGRYIVNGPALIDKCYFEGNGMGQNTDANAVVYTEDWNSRTRIQYSYFVANHIPCIAGGGNRNGSDSVEIFNNTIINNHSIGFSAQNWGGGQKFYLTNNIIEGNTPNLFFNNMGYSQLFFQNNYISPFSKNEEPNPLYFFISHVNTDSMGNGGVTLNTGNGIYELAPSSKLIGAGVPIASLNADFLGQMVPSPLNSTPDLGAIESNAGAPTIIFDSIQPVCSSEPNFLLNNASPRGGNYAGRGVINGLTFSPSLAGPGIHMVSYTFVNANNISIVDSFQIEVLFSPLVQLNNLGDSILCAGGSVLLVADSVAGATYRWIQEDGIVGGLMVEVFSTHAGVGSGNDYPAYPTSRAEFDKFFDTTYQSTSLHYQGRHNALQSLNWSGMSALTNAGIAVPNNGDFFAVQVSGFFNPSETGTYRFNASSDDHMDLIIGDSLVLSSYVTRDGLIHLQAGQRVAFKARMQEYGGHESFNLRWEKPSRLNTANWQLDTLELNGSRGAVVLSDTGRSITASESGTYRAEVTTSTGCTVSSNGLQIEVLPLPVVRLASFDPVCLTDSVTIPLTGGWPAGGVYSGVGVSNGVFDPLVAGAGIHEIGYTYTDSLGNGCTNTATQQMVVLPLAVNIQVDDYCAPSQAVARIADSSVYAVQWFRNNQMIQEKPISYEFAGEAILTGLSFPYDMVVDAQGNRYVVEMHGHRVIRYAPGQQTFTVVAGGNGNGTELNQLHNPTGVAIDAAGNVFVADHSNHRIVRWSPGATQGVVVAGSALGVHGSATNQLHSPYHLKFDSQGRLYVTDVNNSRIMRYAGTVSTTTTALTGTVIVGSAGAGSANNQLSGPYALFIDIHTNRMYVSDDGNARIMRYDLSATSVANSGSRVAGGNGHGTGLNQFSHHIAGILVQGGEIYIADLHAERIMRWREGASVGEVIAGGVGHGSQLFRTSRPTAVRIDAQGNLEYLERDFGRLVRFDANKLNIDTLAFTEAGVYRAEFKRFGTSCVSASADFTIKKPIAQITSSRGSTVCEGDTTTLSTPALAGYAYQWYKDSQSIAGANTNTYITSVPGIYTVEAGDSSGCFNSSEPFMIHFLPQVSLTTDGLCLGSQLTTNVPDSNVVQIDWYRNNQLIKQVNRKYQEEGEPVLGNFNGWINNVTLHWGMGDFHIHTDGSIYISNDRRVIRYFPSTGQFEVVAGGNGEGNALNQLNDPRGIFVAPNGDVFIADFGNHRVVRWSPGATQGVVVAGATSIAGTALNRLNHPSDVFIDLMGNLYIADNHNHRIVRWAPGATTGVLVAGTVGQAGSGLNNLAHPKSIFVNSTGKIYVVDDQNHRIMSYDAGSTIGNIEAGGNGQGPGLNQLNHPQDLHVDAEGIMYIADHYNHRILKWEPNKPFGEVLIGGNGGGSALNQLSHPWSVKMDANRVLYVNIGVPRLMRFDLAEMPADTLFAEDAGNYHVNMRTLQGCENNSQSHTIFAPEVSLSSSRGFDVCEGDTTLLSTIQDSTYTYQWFRDGAQIAGATASSLTAFDPGLYHVAVLDSNACSRTSESMRIWLKPVVNLTADGLCLGSQLTTNVPDSNVVQMDWYRNNQLIKQVNRKYQEEGEPVLGNFNGWINNIPFHWGMGDFHIHTDGSIYISDMHDRRVVRYFPSTGQFTVVAGGNGDGNALNQLSNPQGIFVTSSGDVFIADMNNHRVVRWAPGATQGVVVAGATGIAGTALNRFNHPSDVFIDPSGNMFIADNHNHRVVRWAPGATAGVLVAGTTGQSGGGASNLTHPTSIFIAADGRLYVADNHNHRVMRFTSGSTQGTVVAGGNWAGADLNQLTHPHDIYVDGSNNVYVSDNQNHRVVLWKPGATSGELVVGGFGSGGGLNQVPHPGAIKLANGRSLFVSINGPRLTRFDLAEMPADTLPVTASGSYTTKFTSILGCENTSNTIDVPRLFGSDTVRVFGADTLLAGLNGGAYQQYLWSTGSTDSALLVNATGMYQLTATDTLNGCSREQQIFVYLGRASVVASEIAVCEGAQVRLSVNADNLMSPVSWQPIQVRQTGGHNGSITAQSADSIQIWGNSYNDPTFVALGTDSVSYGEISVLLSMPSPNALPDPKAYIGMMMRERTVSGGTTFSAAPGYVFSMVHGHVYLEDRLKSGNSPAILATKAIPGLDFSTAHLLKMKLGLDDTLRCYLNDLEVLKYGVENTSIVPGYFALGGHNSAYTFKNIRFGGSLTSILWSTGQRGPVITPAISQDTTIGFVIVDGGFSLTGSQFIEMKPIPVVTLTSADSLTFCEGGSALLVADSVLGATYRWIQEDAIVDDFKVEVYSIYGGNGNTIEYGGYPNSKEEFDRLFDTTYINTTLHYDGRHSTNKIFNWDGWQSLQTEGISIPNNGDYFSIRTTGYFVPKQTGIYEFRTGSDDYSDLFINDSLLIASYALLNGRMYLDSGIRVPFTFRMHEYYGGESFNVSWLRPSDMSTNNWVFDFTELRGSAGDVVLSETSRSVLAVQGGIYHAEVTTSTGCTVSSNGLQIEVLPLPVVTLASFDPVCLTDSVTIPLTGGWPAGGVYSGVGVSNGIFDPLVAGAGIHAISYTFTDSLGNGCTNTASQQMLVLPLTVNLQVDDYCAPSLAVASIADSSVYGVQWFRNNQLIQDKPISCAFSGQALLTDLGYPYDMVVDAQGYRYIVQMHAQRVVRYAPGQQNFTVVAGGNGNGAGLNQLHNPTGVAVDAAGNVFVADHSNHRIVRWAPGDTVGVVVAGSTLGINGTATNQLHHPYQLKFDGLGRLYVTDRDNHRVMRYPATVSTTTTALAGTVVVGAAGIGGANNQLQSPHALFIDVQTNRMYVTDDNNARIMRYDLSATNVANSGTRVAGGNGHGTGLNQFSNHIAGILVLGGDIYIADIWGSRILRWKEGAASGQVIAGGTGYGSELFRTSRPTAVRIDAQGNLEYLERDHGRLVRFAANSSNSDTLSFTEAGVYRAEFKRFGLNCVSTSMDFTINKPIARITSSRGATVCEGDTTTLSTPALAGYAYQWYKDGQSIAGANTNTYITSVPGSYTVETGDSSGCFHTSEAFIIHAEPQVTLTADGLCLGSMLQVSIADSSVVGFDWVQNGTIVKQVRAGFEEEGEPFVASNTGNTFGLDQPFDLATDHLGNIYYSEHGNHRVVRRAPDGSSPLVVAGNGSAGAGLSSLDRPTGIFVDAAFNVYVADMGNHRVVKWAPGATQGELVAGTTGVAGSTLARLNEPMDVVVDDSGAVYVADKNNHRVVRWLPNATSGVLFAGTGTSGSSINQLNEPHGLAIWMGGVYIADHWNSRVIRVFNGINTVVATNLPNGDQRISSVHVDKTGAIYLSELFNNRVVRWFPGASTGEVVAGGNSNGNAANQLGQQIYGITTDLQGNLYVADGIWNQRIMKYNRVIIEIDSFVPTASGSYGLMTHTVQGCSFQHSVVLPILSPEVNLTSSAGIDVCEGDTTQLSTIQDSTYTYQWFKNGIQIAGAAASSLTAFEPGIYHVEVLDSNACLRASDVMRIWPRPDVSLTADGLCLDSELRTNVPDSNVVQVDWFRNNQVFRTARADFKANGSAHLGYFDGMWLQDIELQGAGISDVHVHHDGSIYVLAQTNQFSGLGVMKYTPSTNAFVLVAGGNGFGNALNQIGDGSGATGGIFVAENGDIFVVDRWNYRVVKWTPGAAQGIVVAGGNGSGSALNQLSNPQSVFVNGSGDVFVVDQSNHRVVRWSIGANTGVVVAGGNGLGAGLNQFNNPRFVTATSNGDLYISDQNNHRVVRYAAGASTGVVVAGGNFSGTALNQLNQPNGIAVDKSGNVFVADRFNNRIVRWAPGSTSGEVVAGLNQGNTSGLDRTTRPVSLKFGSDYRLYVTSVDTVNGSINLNNSNRLMSFELNKLVADTLRAQQGGNYSVVFTNITGCSSVSQVLNVFDPQVNFPALANSCISDVPILLNTATPASGTYFGVGVDTGYFHPSLAGVGTHILYYLYTDTNGCSKLDSQTIQVVPEPVVSIDTLGSMNLCRGESVVLQSPLVTGQTYQWYRNGVLIPQATQRAFTVLDTVSALYHVMVTRNVCEKSSDTLEVVVRPKPVVTITNQGAATICQGDSVVLQAASDTDVTYQWYRNNQLLVGSTQSSLVANQSGSYTCQVIKANGCADTSNVLSLTVLDFPIAQITPASATTVCAGQIVQLNANQGTGLTHRWFRNGVLIPGATSANYQATTSGDYTVEVKREQLCETLSQAVTVLVNPLPQISIAVTQGNQFCSGDSILITAQSTSQVVRYAWFRNGQLLPSDSTANFYATLPGHYNARVFDTAGCDEASDSVQVSYFDPPFANEAICAISVDTLAGRNVVVWEKTAGVRTSSYNVYREGAISGQYILIGNVPFDSLSIFIDTTANPLSQSFRYRIATVDSCGFVSAQSSVHRTIHLSSNIGVNNEVNLFWTSYEGVSVPTHRILRSINGSPFVELASVSGSTFTYTDLTPPQGTKNYLIEISIPGGCNPTGLRMGNLRTASNYSSIQSNKVAVGSGVSVVNRSLAGLHTLYPNPSNGLLTLVRSEQQMGDEVFRIYDARGRLVRTIRFEDQSLVYQIDMVEAADGIYTIRANESNWSARFVIAK